MLKKVMIIVAAIALGSSMLQTEAFARGGGGGGGGHGGGGFGGGHGGGFGGGHGGGFGGHGHFGRDGGSFEDYWPYDDDYGYCHYTRGHRYVCD